MVTISNTNNVVNKKFVYDLGLNPKNIANFEPVFLDYLKKRYPRYLDNAETWYLKLWKDKSDDGLFREAFELDKDNQISELLDCIANGYEYTSEH